MCISNQLDGVDLRAEHLRKPLVDLRLNLATLHDGMVFNIASPQPLLGQSKYSLNRSVYFSDLRCQVCKQLKTSCGIGKRFVNKATG